MVNRIKENNIDCDLEMADAVIYAKTEEEYNDLQKEADAYDKIGIPYEWTEEKILPFETNAYLRVSNQACFNVVKYLDYLLDHIDTDVVNIFEYTKIVKTKEDDEGVMAVTGDDYKIRAKYIINACHYPFYKSFNFFFTKIFPNISYATISETPKDPETGKELVPYGMYINDKKPVYSLRYVLKDGNHMLMLGGNSRDAHQINDYGKELEDLKDFGKGNLKISHYEYEWYNQDYQSTDKIPLIGRIKKSHSYVACAFNQWGMTTSTVSSLVIRDLLIKGNSSYMEVFDPNRCFLTFKTIGYILKMGKTFFETKLLKAILDNNIKKDSGSIIKVGGKKYGVYVDKLGKVYVVKPICPHMHCSLLFNNVAKTYDCPCHGSRFRYDGQCIDGPAPKDLERVDSDRIEINIKD
jgi:nitrite reductase/ring-hydroxylating ferredoxin subunit/glycine/D-amino acid oxidase-like deaminating enzyme